MEQEFLAIRKEAKRRLEVYKTIINVFMDDVPQYKFDPCIWCKMEKRNGFVEEDIKKKCGEICTFNVTCAYILPRATAYEPHLYGKYLDQIIELNDYVITTSSTNEPHDEKFQNMFIEMYIMPNEVEKIIKFCKDKGYLYTCIVDNKLVDSKFIPEAKHFITTEIAESKLMLYDYPGTYDNVNDKFFIEKPAFISIEDPVMENRDLYTNVLKFYKSSN
jgi:hypothetical protein